MLNLIRNDFCGRLVNKLARRINLLSLFALLRRFQQMSAITAANTKYSNLLYETLKRLSFDVAEHFKLDDSEYGQRLYIALLGLSEVVSRVVENVEHVRKVAPQYDFDEVTIGNGYRSFVHFMDSAVAHAINTCNVVNTGKQSLLFRKTHFAKEVEAISQVITSLENCFQLLVTLMSWSKPGELFPYEDHSSEDLLSKTEFINQYCFYGRCLGLQFNESIRTILKTISISMATFSEGYYSNGGIAATANVCLASGKFLLEPELRARRIVNISQHAGIDFVKAFWKLSENELLSKISNLGSSLEVNKLLTLSPEPLDFIIDGEKLTVSPPTSHIGLKPIDVRLMSSFRRVGMVNEKIESGSKVGFMLPPSPGLLIHVHGGGFVAQTSKTQQVYLDGWVHSLNVPVLSIDYSLAPEAPFPRALDEVVYVYCYCLQHFSELGTTGQRVVIAGDSAGANLILGALQKLIIMNVPPPHGIFVAYVPVIVSFVPSPSRLLSLMDPLVPLGFMLRCLRAYACTDGTSNKKGKKTGSRSDSFEEVTEDEVKQFTEKASKGTTYVLDSEMRNGKDVAVVRALDESRDRNNGIFGSAYNLLCKLRQVEPHVLDNAELSTPSDDFKFTVPKDPLLSPYWASDDILRKFPPVSLCSVESDPCLDDTVMFAKKLKGLGNVVRLDVLEGLPHGFLNFCKLNAEAEEGSKLCVKRIKDLLDLSSIAPGNDFPLINTRPSSEHLCGRITDDNDDDGGDDDDDDDDDVMFEKDKEKNQPPPLSDST